MTTDEDFLVAEPKDSLHEYLLGTEPDEVDIYLGELSSGVSENLDELLINKEITPLKALELKQRCLKLVNLTKTIQRNCLRLENLLVEFSKSDKRIESAKRKRDEFPDGFDTEPYNFRKQILRAENEVKEIEYSTESFQYQIPPLEDERQLLAKQAAKYPDDETIKARRKEIEREIDAEMVERQKFNLEARRLHRQIHATSERKDQLTDELNEAQKSIISLTTQFDSIKSQPEELVEENAKIELALRHLRALLDKTVSQNKELMEKRSNFEDSNNQIAKESEIVSKRNTKLQDLTVKVIDQLALAKQNCQGLITEENQLRTSNAKMETDVENLVDEKKRFLESNNQIVKSGGTTRKLIRQGLKKISHLEETIKYLEETRKARRDELEMVKKEASKRDLKQREELTTQISRLTTKIISQNEYTDRETEQIQQLMKEKIKSLNEIETYKRGLSDLHHILSVKNFEVSQKKQYLRKAQLHHTQVKRDLKLQQFHLNDHRKTLLSLQRQLASFGKLYKAVNVERNECLTLINLAQQKKLTVGEKICFYENELSILQSGLAAKQDQLDNVKGQMERIRRESISIRVELSKQTQLNRELECNLNWMSKNIDRLNRSLEHEKIRAGHVQRQMEVAIQKRDHCKDKLNLLETEIKQNQEIINGLEHKEKESRDALSAKNREFALLLRKNQTEARSVEVLRLKVSEKESIRDELKEVENQTANAQIKLHELELVADIPSPRNSNNRLRFLEGSDPSLESLTNKKKCLLSSLSKKEAELQSNQIILNIVDDLVSKLETEKDENGEESLQITKSINSAYRANHKKDVELKATCAELRMNILYSTVLKKDFDEPEKRGIRNQRRSKQNRLLLLEEENNLKFYTSKIIPQLTISSAHKFFGQ
ncbi:hypothetical protein Aperf_G00000060317 [Anoplocephala perfoliata]